MLMGAAHHLLNVLYSCRSLSIAVDGIDTPMEHHWLYSLDVRRVGA